MGDYPVLPEKNLRDYAREQYNDNSDKNGDWLKDECRFHLYKSHDEMSKATYHAEQGNVDMACKRMGDAYNHLVFAFDINTS